MPVDRHVERVARRVGLIGPKATADDAHDLFLGMLEPDQMYEAHVNLIQHGRKVCHAQRPGPRRLPAAAALDEVDVRLVHLVGLEHAQEEVVGIVGRRYPK